MRPTLNELAIKYRTDKGRNGHDYARHYERLLGDRRHEPLTILEVGTWRGGGLLMWAEWAPNSAVHGVDVAPEKTPEHPRVITVVQDVRDFVPVHLYDVIVDDGSHEHSDIIAAHARLRPMLLPGGFYFVEDVSSPIDGLEYEMVAPYLARVA